MFITKTRYGRSAPAQTQNQKNIYTLTQNPNPKNFWVRLILSQLKIFVNYYSKA